MKEKLEDVGFNRDDLNTLTELAIKTPSLNVFLQQSLVEANEALVIIYEESLAPLNK